MITFIAWIALSRFCCSIEKVSWTISVAFSGSIGVTYKLETATAGDFTFNINNRHNSRYFLSGDNYTRQNRHELIDASIAWLSANGHFDAQVFGRNLTNRYVYATSIVAGNFLVVPGAPRTYGIQLGYHY